jgi:DNA-binding HxlR family transcriptional regulator
MENISLVEVLDAISNENALLVFKTIAQTQGNSDLLRTKLNITRKQYYSRISLLLKTGLIKRTNGRYSLTAFGEIVYEATMTLEKAFDSEYYWKLKALDSFDSTSDQNHVMSSDERNKIIQVLLKDDHDLRKILSSGT